MSEIKLTRQQIYDAVWDMGPRKAADKLGVSYRKLLKACNDNNIPIPGNDFFRNRLKKLPITKPFMFPAENEEITLEKIVRRNRVKNDSMFGAKANTICIMQLLEDYTDDIKTLTIQDIIRLLKDNYNLVADRRTVKDSIELLIDLGYEISAEKENGQYRYSLIENYFTTSEYMMLHYSVKFNNMIPMILKEDILQKLSSLMSVKKTLWGIDNPSPEILCDKKEELEMCRVYEDIGNAFENHKQVSFTYMVYNINKELVPYREKPYVFIPQRIFMKKGIYYVTGEVVNERYGVTFRIDMIRNTHILEEPIHQMSHEELMEAQGAEKVSDSGKIKIYKSKNDEKAVINPPVYPEADKRIRAKMKCKNSLLGKIFEDFSEDFKHINLSDCGDGEHFIFETGSVSFVNTAHWALSVCNDCEVLEPAELREAVIDKLKRNTYGI